MVSGATGLPVLTVWRKRVYERTCDTIGQVAIWATFCPLSSTLINNRTPMPPQLELAASLHVDLAPPLRIGEMPGGFREVIPILGGLVEGKLAGWVLAGGADWCLTRADGIAEVWARYTIETADGALISILNSGLATKQPDGSWTGHTTPSFEVEAEGYQWLRKSLFVGTLRAEPDGTRVHLEFFRVV